MILHVKYIEGHVKNHVQNAFIIAFAFFGLMLIQPFYLTAAFNPTVGIVYLIVEAIVDGLSGKSVYLYILGYIIAPLVGSLLASLWLKSPSLSNQGEKEEKVGAE